MYSGGMLPNRPVCLLEGILEPVLTCRVLNGLTSNYAKVHLGGINLVFLWIFQTFLLFVGNAGSDFMSAERANVYGIDPTEI